MGGGLTICSTQKKDSTWSGKRWVSEWTRRAITHTANLSGWHCSLFCLGSSWYSKENLLLCYRLLLRGGTKLINLLRKHKMSSGVLVVTLVDRLLFKNKQKKSSFHYLNSCQTKCSAWCFPCQQSDYYSDLFKCLDVLLLRLWKPTLVTGLRCAGRGWYRPTRMRSHSALCAPWCRTLPYTELQDENETLVHIYLHTPLPSLQESRLKAAQHSLVPDTRISLRSEDTAA